jgi:serine/threonine protein kinase
LVVGLFGCLTIGYTNILTNSGSLDRFLCQDRDQPISDERKIELARGIARGVLHLHKHNIVHRDLAARNILLTATGDPKISVLCFFPLFSFIYVFDLFIFAYFE